MCDAITSVDVPLRLIILQHPSETKHAKNTARLVPLCVQRCDIHVGEIAADFKTLIPTLGNAWLIYPNDHSQPIESATPVSSMPDTLIFIDATWKKAFKLYQLNPWLHDLPSWHFKHVPNNHYHIRKTTLAHSVSTLEAIVYVLQTVTDTNAKPLLALMNKMQAQRQRFVDKK